MEKTIPDSFENDSSIRIFYKTVTLYQPGCDFYSMFCYSMRFYNEIYNIYLYFMNQKKHRSGLDYSNIFPIQPMNTPRNSKLPIKHNDMAVAE